MTTLQDAHALTPQAWANRWSQGAGAKARVRTIDVHTHLLVPEATEMTRPHYQPEMDPRTFFSSPRSTELNQEFYAAARDRLTTAPARIADMDAMGIDVQVVAITPFQYFYWADEQLSPRVASLCNERIAETVGADPSRFVGLGTLPLAHVEAACVEAHRVVAEYGFTGVEVGTDVNGVDFDDKRFTPLWETLEELGLVVLLHPAGFTQGQRLTDYYLVNVIGMPLSSTVSVTRMILGGVFERHPALTMVVVHGGGYLTYYAARTDHAFRHRPELREHIDRLPSEYLKQLYFDTTVFDARMLEQLVSTYGADHVLLGTDYPFDMGEPDPLQLVSAARLSQPERDLIVGGNAARLFRLQH